MFPREILWDPEETLPARFRLKLHTDTTQPDTLSFSTFLQRMARDAILLPEDGSSLLGPADI